MQAASGHTAFTQAHRVCRRRSSRSCYRKYARPRCSRCTADALDRTRTPVAAAQAASGSTAFIQAHGVCRRRSLHSCYRKYARPRCSRCTTDAVDRTRSPVAAAQAASGSTAFIQPHRVRRRRSLRSCYRKYARPRCSRCTADAVDRTRTPVAAAQAASGHTAFIQAHRVCRRRSLRRCYRKYPRPRYSRCTADAVDRTRSPVAAVQAASGHTAFIQAHRVCRRRSLRSCFRKYARPQCSRCTTDAVDGTRSPVAAVQAASGSTAFIQAHRVRRRRSSRSCYMWISTARGKWSDRCVHGLLPKMIGP